MLSLTKGRLCSCSKGNPRDIYRTGCPWHLAPSEHPVIWVTPKSRDNLIGCCQANKVRTPAISSARASPRRICPILEREIKLITPSLGLRDNLSHVGVACAAYTAQLFHICAKLHTLASFAGVLPH